LKYFKYIIKYIYLNNLKSTLQSLCREYLSAKMDGIKAAVAELQAAANNETKSTAGDKYETGREMIQQEINLELTRLAEFRNMQAVLDKIPPQVEQSIAQQGALVITATGNYYISIGIGKLLIDGGTYYAISAASPLGMALIGHKAGDTAILNGKPIVIKEVQ